MNESCAVHQIDFQFVPIYRRKKYSVCLKKVEEVKCGHVFTQAILLTGRPLQN